MPPLCDCCAALASNALLSQPCSGEFSLRLQKSQADLSQGQTNSHLHCLNSKALCRIHRKDRNATANPKVRK